MRSLALLAITAFSQTLGSPLQVLEPFNTEHDGSKVWFEDIDGNKLNNKVANLEWCSAPENLSHYRLLKRVKEYIQEEAANDS